MYGAHFIHLSTILLIGLICTLASCSIEKRHYTRGYHVEFFSGKTKWSIPEKSEQPEVQALCAEQNFVNPAAPDSLTVEAGKNVLKAAQPLNNTRIQNENSRKKDLTEPKADNSTDAQYEPAQITAQVHPAAAGSLLFGILSALCFVGMFISSFNPLALVIALTLGLFLFAILAKRLSKRAFEDMHHARNRYSGRGFAAAGLALSVITIVAFLGLLAVMLFGIAFISLS